VLFCSLTKNPEHGSSVQYFVGEFDGHTFVCDTPKEQTDFVGWGRDNYAIVTWSNAPDGRRVALGWQNNWQYGSEEEFPTTDFRSYMSLPCELKLIEHEGRAKLISQPVKEFSSYLKEIHAQQDIAITADYKVPVTLSEKKALWIECLLENKSAQTMGVVLSNDKGEEVKIYFDNKAQAFKVDRTKSGEVDFHEMFAGEIEAPMSSAKQQKLTIVVDRASVECFTDISATLDLVFPTQDYNHITLYTVGGEATAKEIKVSQLEI
jgi:fructan beta-fructosidase